MDKQEKPLLAKFQVVLPDKVSLEEFNAKCTGTGPKGTITGGSGNIPQDVLADVDIDW
jgi:hypothetical protein